MCIDADVKILVGQDAMESEKKIGHMRPFIRQRADSLPIWKSRSSGQPSSAPVLDNHMNEGMDAAEEDNYEKIEEVYIKTVSRDDTYTSESGNQNLIIII